MLATLLWFPYATGPLSLINRYRLTFADRPLGQILMTESSTPNTSDSSNPASPGGPTGNRNLLIGIGVALVLGLGLLAFAGGNSDTTNAGNDTGHVAADSIHDFTLGAPDGSTTSLADYAGKPMVVNYFAAWCPPCRRELPDFEAVHLELGDEVAIVGVSRDNTTSAWLGLIESTGLTFDTLYEGNVVGSYEFVGGLAMPTTAFVSADGEIMHTFSGALTQKGLTDLINEHLLTS